MTQEAPLISMPGALDRAERAAAALAGALKELTEPTPCEADEDDLWFSPKRRELETASKLCTACPVLIECGEMPRHDIRITHGVWGGRIVTPAKQPDSL